MCHTPPHTVDTSAAFYFVTICAQNRDANPLLPFADEIIDSARFRHMQHLWFLSLLTVMPDHIHLLAHIPDGHALATVIGSWKHYLSHKYNIEFQKDFFDTRIRNAAHYAEKWDYIVRNPVARGLVATPREWPHVIAFNRTTGEEMPHR